MHYLVLYYHRRHLRIYEAFVIPDARNATDAKRKAAKLEPLKQNQVAGATKLSTVKYQWHVLGWEPKTSLWKQR
jgi:hypothetical protein